MKLLKTEMRMNEESFAPELVVHIVLPMEVGKQISDAENDDGLFSKIGMQLVTLLRNHKE